MLKLKYKQQTLILTTIILAGNKIAKICNETLENKVLRPQVFALALGCCSLVRGEPMKR